MINIHAWATSSTHIGVEAYMTKLVLIILQKDSSQETVISLLGMLVSSQVTLLLRTVRPCILLHCGRAGLLRGTFCLLLADHHAGWEHRSILGNYANGDLEYAHCSAVDTFGDELRCGELR
jgi:hypothetical protein